jgi:hypothetical protein
MDVSEHKVQRTITEVVIYPEHAQRTESEEFRKNRERLKEDGHFHCYVCKTVEDLEAHHFGCEWALWDDCDPTKLKEFCEEHDIYGYGKLLKNKPIDSPDDIRNLMMICKKHHTAVETGIHETTFPVWVSQATAKAGIEPVPEK